MEHLPSNDPLLCIFLFCSDHSHTHARTARAATKFPMGFAAITPAVVATNCLGGEKPVWVCRLQKGCPVYHPMRIQYCNVAVPQFEETPKLLHSTHYGGPLSHITQAGYHQNSYLYIFVYICSVHTCASNPLFTKHSIRVGCGTTAHSISCSTKKR